MRRWVAAGLAVGMVVGGCAQEQGPGQPAAASSSPPPIGLPPDIEEQLRAKLPEAPAGGRADEATARAVVGGLDLDERVERSVASGGDSVGVALRAYPRACVLARIMPDGIEVWRPPRVMQQPGELACRADEAVRGLGRQPPH